jgi:hypothetical protein
MAIAEDKELNQAVLNLITKCQAKGIVGIQRNIGEWFVSFRFSKNQVETVTPAKGANVEKMGDALSGLGDDITNAFIGG